MGETTALGPASPWRLRRRGSKIVAFLMSVVAVALGAANATGQATASAAGRLAATPVAKAACSSAGTAKEAIVDLGSHRSLDRLRTVCVGTLAGTGVIDAGALFVLQDIGPAQDAGATDVVRVDLKTYAVARSAPLAAGSSIFAGVGDIWVVTDSIDPSLVQLSPVSLPVMHRFADPGSGSPRSASWRSPPRCGATSDRPES